MLTAQSFVETCLVQKETRSPDAGLSSSLIRCGQLHLWYVHLCCGGTCREITSTSQDPIKVHTVDLGVSAPRLSRARSRPLNTPLVDPVSTLYSQSIAS